MKQYDKIVADDYSLNLAIDQVLERFNYRRRKNNTTELEDIHTVVGGAKFFVVMIVSYDDYKPDTSQAPPQQPRYIGQQPETEPDISDA